VLDRFDLGEIKTQTFVNIVKALNLKSALIVTEAKNERLERSSRNGACLHVTR